jgi:hypothetical protein
MKFRAIKTMYNGIEFKSRFEANVAMLLDKMGQRWEYEPKSFLLPSGHYMPDFCVFGESGESKTWIEARGYDGKDWQLSEFVGVLTPKDAYIVFKKNKIGLFGFLTHNGWGESAMLLNNVPGRWLILPDFDHGEKITYRNGQIFINNQTVQEWVPVDLIHRRGF